MGERGNSIARGRKCDECSMGKISRALGLEEFEEGGGTVSREAGEKFVAIIQQRSKAGMS